MSSWVEALGALLAGAAALYASLMGLSTYSQSLRDRRVQTMIELERDFKPVFETFSRIDDDACYQKTFAATLDKVLTDQPLSDAERSQVRDIDLCIRFFYLLWVRLKLTPEEHGVPRIYAYYLGLIFDRPELRRYAERYYPILRELAVKIGALNPAQRAPQD